jgi:hypothetical protein
LQPNGRGRFTRRRKLLLSLGLLSFVNSRSLSLSLSLSLSPNPKTPYSHGEDLITCIILNIKDKYIHIDRIIKPVEALLDHVSLETAFLYFIVLILWIFASILH